MKSTGLILTGATLLAGAVAQDAFLWTVDAGIVRHSSIQTSSISSNVASSIIARRRGATMKRYLHTTDDAVLSTINKFSGYQNPLFGADSDGRPEKIMIRISGFDGTMSEFQSLPDLWIERPSIDLQDDFRARSDIESDVCEYNLKIPANGDVGIVYAYYSNGESCKSVSEVEKLPTVLSIFSATPTAKNVVEDISTLLRVVNDLGATANIETTILVLPPISSLHKSKTRRLAQAEEPLDLPFSESSDQPQDISASQQSNTTRPLPKVIPQCFTSESACNNVTNSCSGHGSCYRAHPSCFKCRCGTTVLQREAGKKTIQWGGNACQKKDISMPFAMFATYGIVMTAVVAGGIGMLYSMGSQELPSVLGAGVTGPKAHK